MRASRSPVLGRTPRDGDIPEELQALGVTEHHQEDTKLTPEKEREFEELMKAMEIIPPIEARYRIEVIFTDERSRFRAFPGVVTAWVSSGGDHGGGDSNLYFCPAKVETETGYRDCNAPLLPVMIAKNAAFCPECRRTSSPRALTGQVFARLHFQGWAVLMERMFRHLESNADIRMGVFRGDLIKTTYEELEKPRKGEKLYKVYADRDWISYRLDALIKDMSAGSDLNKRLRAFLGG